MAKGWLSLGLVLLGSSVCVACGPVDPEPPHAPAPALCVDVDGDGYGENCALGEDCDDEDPVVIGRCEGEAATCEEGAERYCRARIDAGEGPPLCWEGTQRCYDGVWGMCESEEWGLGEGNGELDGDDEEEGE